MAASFRDRYTLFSTVQTCIRFESLVSCKLSNFQFVSIKLPDEIDPYPTLFRNIKVCKNLQQDSGKKITVQAKSFRHRDVTRCEQGALAFYLFMRFMITNESFDFSDNKKWHHTRTCVAIGNPNAGNQEKFMTIGRNKSMGSSTFRRAMEGAFEACGYHPSHTVHFGRSCAPVLLEFAEVMGELIKVLGNWGLEVYEKHYGMKMPWEAMRAAAGFVKEIGSYYLPRAHILPPQELKDLVFPVIIKAQLRFNELPTDVKKTKDTVRNFLEVMDHLSTVFLQDACVLLQDESRASHRFFQLPIFQSSLFREYKQKFDCEYATLINPDNDPTFDPLKKAVPRVGHHLHQLDIEQHRQGQRLYQMAQEIKDLHSVTEKAAHRIDQTYSLIQQHHQHVNHVFDAASHANATSPYRVSLRRFEQGTQRSPRPCITGNLNCETAFPSKDSAEFSVPGVVTPQHDGKQYPEFKAVYNSFDTMLCDWYGREGSVFESFGGLQKLTSRGHPFKATLANGRDKQLRRLAKIVRFIEFTCQEEEQSEQDVIKTILEAYKTTKKQEVTIAGAEDVLRTKLGWTKDREKLASGSQT